MFSDQQVGHVICTAHSLHNLFKDISEVFNPGYNKRPDRKRGKSVKKGEGLKKPRLLSDIETITNWIRRKWGALRKLLPKKLKKPPKAIDIRWGSHLLVAKYYLKNWYVLVKALEASQTKAKTHEKVSSEILQKNLTNSCLVNRVSQS